jgi:hypothetical protein
MLAASQPQDGSLYAITKGVEHSGAPHRPGVVRMEDCHRCVLWFLLATSSSLPRVGWQLAGA